MIVMGLDLSLTNTGICVWDSDKDTPMVVTSIATPAKTGKGGKIKVNKWSRFLTITSEIEYQARMKDVDYVVIERAFISFNVASGMVLEALKGYVVCGLMGVETVYHDNIIELPPQTVARLVGLKGNMKRKEKKPAFAAMIERKGIKCKNEDEVDACVIAMAGIVKLLEEK